MINFAKRWLIAIIISVFATSCSSNQSKNNTSGDSGDSTSIGAGTDTTGSMVDTGVVNTDSSVHED